MNFGSGNGRSSRLLVLIVPSLIMLACCTRESKVDVSRNIDPTGMPTMSSRNVATFISDSGWAKYKIVTPLWNVYDEADTPYWSFPKGLYLQQYDRRKRIIASVAADSAHYLTREKLWRLDGHVEMHKEPKELFLTQQLFWDERREKIYSDSFIHVETQTHVLEGFGFVSNNMLNTYRVVNPTGIFPVNRDEINGGGQPNAGSAAPPGSQPETAPVTGTADPTYAQRSVNTKTRAKETTKE